jgi:hypothetical protein
MKKWYRVRLKNFTNGEVLVESGFSTFDRANIFVCNMVKRGFLCEPILYYEDQISYDRDRLPFEPESLYNGIPDGILKLRGDGEYTIYGHTEVKAFNKVRVHAFDNTSVLVYDNATVIAHGPNVRVRYIPEY